MTTPTPERQGLTRKRWVIGVAIILLLSLIYLLQVTVVRGFESPRQSFGFFLRSMFEWSAWGVLSPAILRFAQAFPVGPGRPPRNLVLLGLGGVLVLPLWALLVAIPVSGLSLTLWGSKAPAGFLVTAEAALFQRGPYLSIIYGLIVGLATAWRLTLERQAAATRTAELRRELAAADLDTFTQAIGSDRLVDRLQAVEVVVERSPEEAEAMTLALAQELHTALLRTRDRLHT